MAKFVNIEGLHPIRVFLSVYAEEPILVYKKDDIDRRTAADVAPVVRCEDCISRDFPDEYGISCCVRTGEEVQPTDFCGKGQRKDEVTK